MSSHLGSPPDPAARFVGIYDDVYADVLRFIQRRAHHSHAEDVAADTFLVVWRRLADAPRQHDDVRAWVFGIARHVLLNSRRGVERQRALGVHLRESTAGQRTAADPHVDAVLDRVDLARAWVRLSELHQEALAFVAFDGLDATQASRVLDISPVAFRLRLSRARRALRAHLTHLPETPAVSTSATERTTRDAH